MLRVRCLHSRLRCLAIYRETFSDSLAALENPLDHLEEESGCNFVAVYIYRINAPEEEKTACWCAQLLQAQGVEEGGEGAGTVPKRRRLSAIGAMADEPVQSWLDNLPRDDLALLLATNHIWTLKD